MGDFGVRGVRMERRMVLGGMLVWAVWAAVEWALVVGAKLAMPMCCLPISYWALHAAT